MRDVRSYVLKELLAIRSELTRIYRSGVADLNRIPDSMGAYGTFEAGKKAVIEGIAVIKQLEIPSDPKAAQAASIALESAFKKVSQHLKDKLSPRYGDSGKVEDQIPRSELDRLQRELTAAYQEKRNALYEVWK